MSIICFKWLHLMILYGELLVMKWLQSPFSVAFTGPPRPLACQEVLAFALANSTSLVGEAHDAIETRQRQNTGHPRHRQKYPSADNPHTYRHTFVTLLNRQITKLWILIGD
jgi:hypothetical protein